MNKEIQSFLEQANPDFNAGFSLFCRFSRNQSLMSYIGRKQDMEMLMYELKKLEGTVQENPFAASHEARFNQPTVKPARAVTLPDAPEPDQTQTVFRVYDERRIRRADLPADLQEVYDRTVQEYPVRRGYHEKMKNAKTDADRAVFRAKILETEERIRAGFAVIDKYLAEKETQKVETAFSESNCRAYISKALKKETLSDTVKLGVKVRINALNDHGCTISNELLKELKKRGLL